MFLYEHTHLGRFPNPHQCTFKAYVEFRSTLIRSLTMHCKKYMLVTYFIYFMNKKFHRVKFLGTCLWCSLSLVNSVVSVFREMKMALHGTRRPEDFWKFSNTLGVLIYSIFLAVFCLPKNPSKFSRTIYLVFLYFIFLNKNLFSFYCVWNCMKNLLYFKIPYWWKHLVKHLREIESPKSKIISIFKKY